MPVTYTQFLTLIATALRDENGLDLAHLIRPINPHGKDLVKEFRNPTVRICCLCIAIRNAICRRSGNLCLDTKEL